LINKSAHISYTLLCLPMFRVSKSNFPQQSTG